MLRKSLWLGMALSSAWAVLPAFASPSDRTSTSATQPAKYPATNTVPAAPPDMQAAARSAGTPRPDLPGALWIDRDSDGRVDGYLYKGEIYADGTGKVSDAPIASSRNAQAGAKTANWGGLDLLEGKTFRFHMAGFTRVTTWRWVKAGEVLAVDERINDGPVFTIEHTIDPSTGVVASYSLDPDGTLGTAPVDVEGKSTRTTIRVLGPRAYETRLQQLKRGKWSTPMMGKETYTAVGGGESSSDSGLFGAIAMGVGAALAGGNAEQVMGMAMKGAELTTDNEMSRNVLAGQGDAMVAEGTQRMIAENARSNGAGAGGASSATVDSPGSAAAASNTAALSTSVSQAFVACNLYGQYASGTNWQFYVSRIGQVQTATGELWPDSPSDPIAKSWGNFLRTTGVDVDVFAQGPNPDLPVCHGFHTEAEAAQARARWISDVQSGSGGYTVHTVDWSPSGVNQ